MEKYIYFICNKDVNIVLTDDYFFWTTSVSYYI